MYEARQNKEKVSRRIEIKNINPSSACTKNVNQFPKNVVQRVTWEDDSDKPGEKVCKDYMPNGFIWHYVDGKMYYTTTPALVISIKDKAHREQIEQFANKQLSYKEWDAAGWVFHDTIRGNSSIVIQHDNIKDYIGPTSGIEIENPTPHIISLNKETDRGTIAQILFGENIMAEITTDMGKHPDYTIELRTTPVAIADNTGFMLRKKAIKIAKKVINSANGTQIKDETIEDFTVKVLVKNHTIKSANHKKSGHQITKGIGLTDMINEASKTDGFFSVAHSTWMKHYFTYLNQYTNKQGEIYAMLASMIHFYLERIDRNAMIKELEGSQNNSQSEKQKETGTGSKGVKNGVLEVRPDLVNPARKNEWGLLPKTAPSKWLDGLDKEVASNIKSALNVVPKDLNKTAWETIKRELLSGSEIAGHPVPDFTINNEKAFAFEMRTPPRDEVKKYIDD